MTRRPARVQLQDVAGWHKPDGAVTVARPTVWGNPYQLAVWNRDWIVVDAVGHQIPGGHPQSRDSAQALAVDAYEAALIAGELAYTVEDVAAQLAGRDLACWCPSSSRCHADILLYYANEASSATASTVWP